MPFSTTVAEPWAEVPSGIRPVWRAAVMMEVERSRRREWSHCPLHHDPGSEGFSGSCPSLKGAEAPWRPTLNRSSTGKKQGTL